MFIQQDTRRKTPNLFCYLKYNGEMTNEICILCFLKNLKCATQIFFIVLILYKNAVLLLLHCNVIVIKNSITEGLTPKPIICY